MIRALASAAIILESCYGVTAPGHLRSALDSFEIRDSTVREDCSRLAKTEFPMRPLEETFRGPWVCSKGTRNQEPSKMMSRHLGEPSQHSYALCDHLFFYCCFSRSSKYSRQPQMGPWIFPTLRFSVVFFRLSSCWMSPNCSPFLADCQGGCAQRFHTWCSLPSWQSPYHGAGVPWWPEWKIRHY